ncbi:MAG: flagellar hook-length control protein FliK [Paracoccaceae bacterium]
MSASLVSAQPVSALPETTALQRRLPARPAAPRAGDTAHDTAFDAHLRDTPRPRRIERPTQSQAQRTQRPEKPAEKPHHPADPRTDKAADRSHAHASDRARERASDRAAFKRADHAGEQAAANTAAEQQDEALADSLITSPATRAEHATDDAALTMETAMAAETDLSKDAEAIAAQNDSALAAATAPAAVVAPAAPIPAAVTMIEPDNGQADGEAGLTIGNAGVGQGHGQGQAAKLAAVPGTGGDTAIDGSAGKSADAPRATPADGTGKPDITGAGDGQATRNSNAAEPSPRAAALQDIATGQNGPALGRPHDGLHIHAHHANGLHLQLAPDAASNTPIPPQPQPKAPDAMPVQAVPIAIGMKALEGAREFEIRLDPAELGRVDVKLSISADGRVEASLVVDRVETLALLQRDARTLERAFDQAGLTADANSIQFSLRQDNDGQKKSQQDFDEGGAASHGLSGNDILQQQDRPAQLYRGFVRETAVDIRV